MTGAARLSLVTVLDHYTVLHFGWHGVAGMPLQGSRLDYSDRRVTARRRPPIATAADSPFNSAVSASCKDKFELNLFFNNFCFKINKSASKCQRQTVQAGL
jgi:hypothetical protein